MDNTEVTVEVDRKSWEAVSIKGRGDIMDSATVYIEGFPGA